MTTPITVSLGDLPLQCLHRWERERGNQIFLTQPIGGGAVQDITWIQAADQVRRIAASPTGCRRRAGQRAVGWPSSVKTARTGFWRTWPF
ncbi:hypothetical protein [Rhodoferax sp. UBA5149]|uniref:hypothetical protein n=1 Tax=Rhodoferax sp. UBA5149 TaxID=1947379 RepID=UPI0025F4DF23|nr:hypothetical protein [Rhodoferax sp. UBA5149]